MIDRSSKFWYHLIFAMLRKIESNCQNLIHAKVTLYRLKVYMYDNWSTTFVNKEKKHELKYCNHV